MSKILLFVGFVIALFLIIRAVLLQKPNTELTYTVKKENLVDTVQVSGTYNTAMQTQVTSPTTGIITRIFVKNNEGVRKGDQLFHVESSATEDQKRLAQTNYLAAKAALEADNANLFSLQSTMFSKWNTFFNLATNSKYQNSDNTPNLVNRILPEFTTAQDDWLASEAIYKNQQGVIAKDQAALNSTYLNYQETQNVTVNAPVAGTVVNLIKKENDQVIGPTQSQYSLATNLQTQAFNSTSAEPVLVITDPSNPKIIATVSENYALRITPGQKAFIVFDALKDKTFTGTVESIDSVGTNTAGVVTYHAIIVSDNISSDIKPNMTVLVTIETMRKNDVIDVPNSAITSKDGITYVVDAKNHKYIPVMVGLKGIAKTEITQGLTVNTKIVASPNSQ